MVPRRKRRKTLTPETGAAARPKAALKVVVEDGVYREAPPLRDKEASGLARLSSEERSRKILELILKELDDDKAEEIVTVPLAGKSDIADAMVIASGRSQRHVGAMADKIVRKLKEVGFDRARIEGQPACDWVLIDAEDVIAHLFRPEVRRFYNLERIWSEAAHAALPEA
jgi:ribosome-associated protein